jgi:hypothetical protein
MNRRVLGCWITGVERTWPSSTIATGRPTLAAVSIPNRRPPSGDDADRARRRGAQVKAPAPAQRPRA